MKKHKFYPDKCWCDFDSMNLDQKPRRIHRIKEGHILIEDLPKEAKIVDFGEDINR